MSAHIFEELKFEQWIPHEELNGERERRGKYRQGGDPFTNRAQAALNRIARDQGLIGEIHKRLRDDWRELGAALLGKRKDIVSDKAFGQWIKANRLDRAPADTPGIRSDAMWLAEHWENVRKCCFADISKHEGLHRPNDIRTACRRAGYEWAGAKPKKDGTAKRTKPTQGAKAAKTTTAYPKRSLKLDAFMTEVEFKLVLDCLDPGRQPKDLQPRFAEASEIFTRLKRLLNPDTRAGMANGWEHHPRRP